MLYTMHCSLVIIFLIIIVLVVSRTRQSAGDHQLFDNVLHLLSVLGGLPQHIAPHSQHTQRPAHQRHGETTPTDRHHDDHAAQERLI